MSQPEQYPFTPVVKDGVEYHAGWIITQKMFDIITGNQMEIIETLGLPHKQEEALKSRIRAQVWRVTRDSLFMSAQEVSEKGVEKGLKGDEHFPIGVDTSVESN